MDWCGDIPAWKNMVNTRGYAVSSSTAIFVVLGLDFVFYSGRQLVSWGDGEVIFPNQSIQHKRREWPSLTVLLSTWQICLVPYNLLHQKCQTSWKRQHKAHTWREKWKKALERCCNIIMMFVPSRTHWFAQTQSISDWWYADKMETLRSFTTKTKGVNGASWRNVGKHMIEPSPVVITSRTSGKPTSLPSRKTLSPLLEPQSSPPWILREDTGKWKWIQIPKLRLLSSVHTVYTSSM